MYWFAYWLVTDGNFILASLGYRNRYISYVAYKEVYQ